MKTAYLLGIGGAGMAGLARFLQQKGITVRGYDRAKSVTTHHLEELGISIDYDPNPLRLQRADLCVYSAAIPKDFPLLMKAKETLPTFSRGEMMGNIQREFPKTVAVAGTHGKTTTVGMITQIVKAAGQDPSVLIGGHFPEIGGYGQFGSSPLLICEACEFAESFLHLSPTVGVLLNIDRDHLECYGSFKGLKEGFAAFLHNCQTCVVNGNNPYSVEASHSHPSVTVFGKSGALTAENITEQKGLFSFTLCRTGNPLGEISLQVAGKHQVENALAAATVGFLLGCSFDQIKTGLEAFSGVDRRFQILYRDSTLTIADDYAHHPTEIAAVLSSAKRMGFSSITAIFQPFTFSRTAALCREFADALSLANRVILAPIMAGREPPMQGVTSQLIADDLPQATLCQSLSHCGAVALAGREKGELILTLGCGNVNECALEMAELLKNNPSCA